MAPTPTIGADLTRRGFERVRLWTRGVNHALFRPRANRVLDLPRPIFLSVGRVAVEKNLEALLELDLPGSTVIVGDGPARAQLERRYPHAHFLGARHGEALADVYASADVFVFPSRTDTFGIVLIEAMASGLPVAAFPVPGPIDVVGPGRGRARRGPARGLPRGADDPARGGARIFAALHLEGERAAVPREHRGQPPEACGLARNSLSLSATLSASTEAYAGFAGDAFHALAKICPRLTVVPAGDGGGAPSPQGRKASNLGCRGWPEASHRSVRFAE